MLLHRLFSASIFLIIIAFSIFVSGWLGASVFIITATFLIWQVLNEFTKMMPQVKLNFLRFFSLLYIFLVIAQQLCHHINAIYYDSFYALLIICASLLTLKSKNFKEQFTNYFITIASFFYITWSLSFIAKIYFFIGTDALGRYLTLLLILGVKSADIGAYFTGKTCLALFRKTHKIAPRISPEKSWQGFFGGLGLSILTTYTLINFIPFQTNTLPSYSFIILGIIFNTLGFFGDLIESVIKRSANMKNSGTFIPGMGGALDVVDSLILTSPIFYIILSLSYGL